MPNAQEVLEWMAWDKERKANMTNDEWRKTCSAEEFAEFICKLTRCCRYSCKECPFNGYCAVENSRDAIAWLKEKHEPLKNDEK